MSRPRRRTPIALYLSVGAAVLGGCGEDQVTGPEDPDNAPPSIVAIADQSVIRNTLAPRSLEVPLAVADPDDESFTVTVHSDDEAIVPGTSISCGSGPCILTVTPLADATAEVTLTVAVADGSGGEAETRFMVRVVPRLVTASTDDGPGSLRQAIATAEAGDVIGFDTGGIFDAPQTITLFGQFVLDKHLTIEGTGAESLTVSGSGAVRAFKVIDGAHVTLRDLTIADGRATVETVSLEGTPADVRLGGGAFVGAASRLTLRDAVVAGGTATDEDRPDGGGGIANLGGTLVLIDSDVTANVANDGGGILTLAADGFPGTTTLDGGSVTANTAQGNTGGGVASGPASTLLIRGTSIANNSAEYGGGVASFGTLVVDENTSVTGNTATFNGGGIEAPEGDATITGSTIAGNAAETGGGIRTSDTRLRIRGSTSIEDNTADDGAGIHVGDGSEVSIDASSVVVGNMANSNGGGLFLSGGTLTVTGASCVISANVADADEDGTGEGGGIFNDGGDISGVAVERVCDNAPDDIVEP